MRQQILFSPEELFKEPLKKYEIFFSLFDLFPLESTSGVGRKPLSRAALTRALINRKVIRGRYLSLDACPIKANVKQNNFKDIH